MRDWRLKSRRQLLRTTGTPITKGTISVTTYAGPETITVPEVPDGGKTAIPVVPSWGVRSDTARDLFTETQRFVRRDVPTETIEDRQHGTK
jgi:hypothetical protein